jgi:hypothetical protein
MRIKRPRRSGNSRVTATARLGPGVTNIFSVPMASIGSQIFMDPTPTRTPEGALECISGAVATDPALADTDNVFKPALAAVSAALKAVRYRKSG